MRKMASYVELRDLTKIIELIGDEPGFSSIEGGIDSRELEYFSK